MRTDPVAMNRSVPSDPRSTVAMPKRSRKKTPARMKAAAKGYARFC